MNYVDRTHLNIFNGYPLLPTKENVVGRDWLKEIHTVINMITE